jgi:hypothetical protein
VCALLDAVVGAPAALADEASAAEATAPTAAERSHPPRWLERTAVALLALVAAAALASSTGAAGAAASGRPYFPVSCGTVVGPSWQLGGQSGRSWLVQATIPCARARRLAASHLGRIGPRLPAPRGWRCEGQPYAGACFRLTGRVVADVDWTVAHLLEG